MKWRCTGDPVKLLTFTVLGERCSGTHFLQHAIQKNFGLEYVKGEKHFFGHSEPPELESRLYLIIVRDPVTWIDSLWRHHFHIPECNLQSLEAFLRNEWWSQYNFKNEDGSEIIQDRHIFEKRRYKNIFEMRAVKYRYLLHHFYPSAPFVCFLTYEELLHNYQSVLGEIGQAFDLVRVNDVLETYLDVPYYKGGYNRLFEPKRVELRSADISYIYANLDPDQETEDFGYSNVTSKID